MTGGGLPDWGTLGAGSALSAGVALAVLLTTFGVALARGVHRIVDVAWGLAFTAVAATGFVLATAQGAGDEGRRLVTLVLTAVWGLRLSAHIARRGWGKGEDPRYERLLARAPGARRWYALRSVYLLQAALVWLVSLPVQAAMYVPARPGPAVWAGAAVWLVGMVFEAGGDAQLARHTADPANRGRIMDRGLWSWTRHPNYFGDCCVWWGLYLMCVPGIDPGQLGAAAPLLVASLVSPVVMTLLLTKGSGKRLLERHMAQRPGYAAYARRTSGFFPRPPRSPPT